MDRPTDKELIERLKEYNMQSCGLTRLEGVNYTVWIKIQKPRHEEDDQEN